MMTINGTRTQAKCFTDNIEERAAEQILTMCSLDCSAGSKIRIMPDVHAGKGCTIGTTMTIQDTVVPAFVGVDIGCGMYTVSLGTQEIDMERLDAAAHLIPSGMNVWDEPIESFELSSLRCKDMLKTPLRLQKSLGTLGGGNHFIEIDENSKGERFLIIHSGSRNLGKQVAEIYIEKAMDEERGIYDYKAQRINLIQTLKEQGRMQEISTELAELKKKKEQATVLPPALLPISGQNFKDYMHDIEICQEFARLNRERIAQKLLEFTGLVSYGAFHTIHNYIDPNEMILRKGAIAAHAGELVLIPINMRDGSILARGKGNPDWNYSAPHGAGRIMSRKQARDQLTLDEFEKQMDGVYTTSVNMSTLDEAPMAYKSINDIVPFISDTVEIIEVIKPIYNFKAEE